MLYQIHFDNYPLFHRVNYLVQDLIYNSNFKVKGKKLKLAQSIDDKMGEIWKAMDSWNREGTINHDLILTEEEALFLSVWLQARVNHYPNLAALRDTLTPVEVGIAA